MKSFAPRLLAFPIHSFRCIYVDPPEYMHSHTPNNDLWHFDSNNSMSKMNFIGEWIYNCNIRNTGLAVKQVRSSDINTSYSVHNHIEIDMLETFRVSDEHQKMANWSKRSEQSIYMKCTWHEVHIHSRRHCCRCMWIQLWRLFRCTGWPLSIQFNRRSTYSVIKEPTWG